MGRVLSLISPNQIQISYLDFSGRGKKSYLCVQLFLAHSISYGIKIDNCFFGYTKQLTLLVQSFDSLIVSLDNIPANSGPD